MITTAVKYRLLKMYMVLIWIGLIASFLYLPQLLPRLETKTINVFAWSGMFDSATIAQFEDKTGIKVNFSYYESNEELLAKLRATKGKGYDLIMPSDYTVNILSQEKLLKKLDRAKMAFFKYINPALLGHYYDPANDYSVPFEWSIFGIGIDKDFFGHCQPKPTWGLLFDHAYRTSKVVMVNDPLVAIPIAALYLFGSFNHLNTSHLQVIKELLIKQRPYVEAYTDFRADYYLITKNCPVAAGSSSYIGRSMNQYPHINFIIPDEGTLITIESCVIPTSSTKEDLVYHFMDFIFSPEIVAYNFRKFGYFPTTTDVLDYLEPSDNMGSLLTRALQDIASFSFLRLSDFCKPITEQHLQDLWVAVKS
jgi:spermidine/putrescine-binding protein